ncbi:hypothetical protein GGD81_000687 [Rhodobium orientis]|uniref:SGNH hydrolase-type esterase domain-containing protein n=1 Tax=Rhodobium orientis TaxID=34017 RepID=A0A327JDE1_9HYPH|nr:hypothetical protein [Rhodobium orientis]MBB4301670.1 hypothetical protein [Rhodobium orientis]MBK5952365.1 hypothetical protein [Rhodobium orientis]RAI24145.1 hypothetical protein CH339_22665 [Rhodobium orientis]
MIKVFGDSHANRISKLGTIPEGFEVFGSHGQNVLSFRLTEQDGGLHIFADNWEGVPPLDVTLLPSDLNVLSGPFHSSPISRNDTWRRHCHWTLHEAFPKLSPVSDAVMDAVVDDRLAAMFRLIKACQNMDIPIVVIEAPLIRRTESTFRGIEEEVLVDTDRRYRDTVRARLAGAGVPVIATPPETNDGRFTKDEFGAEIATDVHHGNRDYVKLAIESVVAFAEAHGYC